MPTDNQILQTMTRARKIYWILKFGTMFADTEQRRVTLLSDLVSMGFIDGRKLTFEITDWIRSGVHIPQDVEKPLLEWWEDRG